MKTTLAIILISFFLGSQTEITLKTDQSTMQVLGTSSIHDWESDVERYSIKGVLSDDNQIMNLNVEVKTKSIKSGKSIMDDKTYDALMADDYPVITFSASQLTINGQKITGQGQLSMAGRTKSIPVEATVLERSAGSIKLKGEVKLKMTDFGIDPPTAMFGTMVTGDEVTIRYDLLLAN